MRAQLLKLSAKSWCFRPAASLRQATQLMTVPCCGAYRLQSCWKKNNFEDAECARFIDKYQSCVAQSKVSDRSQVLVPRWIETPHTIAGICSPPFFICSLPVKLTCSARRILPSLHTYRHCGTDDPASKYELLVLCSLRLRNGREPGRSSTCLCCIRRVDACRPFAFIESSRLSFSVQPATTGRHARSPLAGNTRILTAWQ